MNNIIPIEKSIYIAIPSSYSTTQKGGFFEKLCAQILSKQSYAIESMEIRKSGMEVDIEARHTPSDKKIYVECKFYNNKYTLESSILDLCFSQSFRGGHDAIALFSTVKLGKDAQAVLEDYKKRKVDFSFYDTQEILNSLIVSGLVKDIQANDLKPNYSNATLLLHPEISPHWLYQEIEDGTPIHLVYQSLGSTASAERLRKILDKENIFLGLDLKNINADNGVEKPSTYQTKEIVSNIILADDIMDYKPCRPQDFVGREDIQKEIWEFLDAVREHRTDCRILSLTGSSGNGKSSLVANLAHRFTNIKWKNKFFLYPVDIRSARGPRFVAEVVTKAFNSALKEKFIDLNLSFKVENINEILNGADFNSCDSYLRDNNKVLIIFFDQFEEVFMKEDLFTLFEAFKRFGLDIAGEKTNLVLGFSWRNGIFLGDDNPAYSLWNELKDHRIEKKLKLFDERDSSQMISTFERSESIKLTSPLKRRLIQQAQGYPWLLKKLCIHLFKKINEGISQELLLINQLQIKTLFDEDLERPNREVDCLKYVALNSPVNRYQTTQEFGEGTVSRLISDRLLIKTGEKISVYWDVFRDYLKTNEAPIISWAYMPTTNISSALKLLKLIDETSSPTYEDLIDSSNYSRGTLQNIMMDLQSFSLVKKLDNGVFQITTDIDQVPKKVRDQLLGHSVYIRCLEHIKFFDSDFIKLSEVNEIVNDIYPKSKNTNHYLIRIFSWLKFAGLVNQVGHSIRLHKSDTYSPEYGNPDNKSRDSLFVAASTFENAVILIQRLRNEVEIDSKEAGIRNVILDLINLGICTRKNGNISLLPSKYSDLDPITFLGIHVLKTDTILLLQKLQQKYGDNLDKLAFEMASELNKNWRLSSGQRYVRALIRYNNCAQNV